MFRLLLGLGLGYLTYVVVKKVGHSLGFWHRSSRPLDQGREPDVLVQDPVCKTFIPRREALRMQQDGMIYFFCSEGCLKRFQSGSKS